MTRQHRYAIAFVVALSVADLAFAQTAKPSTPPVAAPVAPKQPSRPLLQIANGRITLPEREHLLATLLEGISTAMGIAIVEDEAIGNRRIIIGLQDVPVDEALRQLLASFDAFFFYGIDQRAPARLQVVWIYPKGRGRGLAPVPPERWASTSDLDERLRSGDADARASAIETLVERKGAGALSDVLRALADVDDQVRQRAFSAALAASVELPIDTLMQGLGDASPEVRFLALESASGRPEARAMAEFARDDADVHVKARARQILENLDAAARPHGEPAAMPRPLASGSAAPPRPRIAAPQGVASSQRPGVPAGVSSPVPTVPLLMLTPIETAARPGMSAVRTNEADTFATAQPATPTDLTRQLRDASEEVRTRALYRSLAEGVPLATEILRRALADPSEGVRLLALEALAERPDGLVYVTDALGDASPHVRARAQQILNTQRRPR